MYVYKYAFEVYILDMYSLSTEHIEQHICEHYTMSLMYTAQWIYILHIHFTYTYVYIYVWYIYVYICIYFIYTYVTYSLIERRACRVAYLRVLQDVVDAHCTMNIRIIYICIYICIYKIWIHIYILNKYTFYTCTHGAPSTSSGIFENTIKCRLCILHKKYAYFICIYLRIYYFIYMCTCISHIYIYILAYIYYIWQCKFILIDVAFVTR